MITGVGDISNDLLNTIGGYINAFGGPSYAIGVNLAQNEIANQATPEQKAAVLEATTGFAPADYSTLNTLVSDFGSGASTVANAPNWIVSAGLIAGIVVLILVMR